MEDKYLRLNFRFPDPIIWIYYHVWKTTNTPEQNLAAYYPRLSEAGGEGSTNNNQTSTLTMRDGRFLRLKNFEIGYTIQWLKGEDEKYRT